MEKMTTPLCDVQYGEELERNPLTGLYSPRGFMEKSRVFIRNIEPGTYCMMAIDMLHFRLFNKLYGREIGDKLLRHIADCLESVRRQHDGVTGYFEGDNFSIVMPWNMELVEELQDDIIAEVERWGGAVGVIPSMGMCPIDNITLPPEIFYDRATLALHQASGRNRIVQYDPGMEDRLEEELRLLMEINTALDEDEFIFYAQPQCDIFAGKVVGAESLVRWQHKTKGLIPPVKFIPVLERSGMIYQLDQKVWEKVCQWLRSWIDRGYRPVPISINISRIDIMAIDVPTYLIGLLEKYDLPVKYLKVEITESAYAEEDSTINNTVNRLREAGFLVMMDDFGSGYSSLNMLKSIAVDVLKIDMRFLEISEEETQKGIGILESIVNMARMMGMPIIVEGVETLHQENVVRNMGCRYTQGYYYYKPLPIEQFERLLADERRLDFSGLHRKQVEAFHVREFLDGSQFTDTMLNNILGPSAIYDVYENQIEITRVNEQYYNLSGLDVMDDNLNKKLWSSVQGDDRAVLFELFEEAFESHPNSAEGYIHYLRVDGKVLWVRVFFQREKEGHKLFFVLLSDMTSVREQRMEQAKTDTSAFEFSPEEKAELERYYGNLPYGYGLAQVLLNGIGELEDYKIIYANQQMEKMCNGDISRLRDLMRKAFGDDKQEMLRKAYQAAFLGDTLNHYAYNSITGHYLQITFYQYEYGYVACLMRDVTHMQLRERTFNSMVLAYREVYFLHIQDNYCRMIYPDETRVMERGNFQSIVEHHFVSGRIVSGDEENVRRFLSLENLQTALATQDSVEYRYRRRTRCGGEEWCLTSVTISDRENGVPKTAVITIRSIEAILQEEENRRQSRMVQSLASMSDCFFVYQAMRDERILYANPAVMELYGCESMDEFMELTGRSFRGMVHPEDLDRVEWEIEQQVRQSDDNMDYVQYRILRKDGQIRWVDDWGHLEHSRWGEENRLFYVFMKDITDSITPLQQEDLISNSLYHKNRLEEEHME